MKITIEINTCADCVCQDHSGAFTPGGARPICGHKDACGVARVSKKEFKEIYPGNKKEIKGEYWLRHWWRHWIHRVIPHKHIKDAKRFEPSRLITGIPDWCPLKNGSKYPKHKY